MGINYDAVIVGGGFYGCMIAIFLKRVKGFSKVVIIERESDILLRSSRNNQARVHEGYHYPRSFTTAYRSFINAKVFKKRWTGALKKSRLNLYAIAKKNSKMNKQQFYRFCNEVGASLEAAPADIVKMFNASLIEAVYCVEEDTFDIEKIKAVLVQELKELSIEIKTGAHVKKISPDGANSQGLKVKYSCSGSERELGAKYMFNCTYSGLNSIEGFRIDNKIKHELTEMLLVRPTAFINQMALTVMDGPFFSLMPYPSTPYYTLSHVRYTPHYSWQDKGGECPYEVLQSYDGQSRANWMMRDAAKYFPELARCKVVDSIFEVKSVLCQNETDDGRPILFERSQSLPGVFSVLGGKIDNVYDILDRIQSLDFHLEMNK